MASDNVDDHLRIFRRQYLQLSDADFLAWPPKALLRDAGVQEWLYRNLFAERDGYFLPPVRYQARVLKTLVSKIEQAIEDPNEDEINDALMSHFSSLLASNLPTELTAVQQRAYVTFTCVPSHGRRLDSEPTITLLERRNLISGSRTTGFRTWEAALHLAEFLLREENRHLIENKSVMELGAGTGFLAILCAKHLQAKHVTTTDGDEAVIDTLKDNLFLNGLDDGQAVSASVLRWGHSLQHSWVRDDFEDWPYDIVLGADIIYDKTAVSALVATLTMLFDLKPTIHVIMASAIRNAETFETFRFVCSRQQLQVEEISFTAKPMREQLGLFYATAVPLKILSIRAPIQQLQPCA